MVGLELVMASHLFIQAAAGAELCPVQKNARVDVRWRSEPVTYNFSKSMSQLESGHIDTKNPYGTHVATDVGGLTSGNIAYTSGIQVSTIRFPATRTGCLWIDKISVDIVLDPTVYIAKEHPQGSCEFKAIVEHEHKHVATDRAIIEARVENIRKIVTAAVQKVGVVGPKPDTQMETFKQKMSDYIEGSLKSAMDAVYVERAKRQQMIDTKQEYDRVSAQCP